MTEQLKTELLPCPFCGGEPDMLLDAYKRHYVTCLLCQFQMPAYSRGFEKKAIAAWNRRASQAQEGFVLVPKEPTREMLQVYQDWHRQGKGHMDISIYKAVIAAAPAGGETEKSQAMTEQQRREVDGVAQWGSLE